MSARATHTKPARLLVRAAVVICVLYLSSYAGLRAAGVFAHYYQRWDDGGEHHYVGVSFGVWMKSGNRYVGRALPVLRYAYAPLTGLERRYHYWRAGVVERVTVTSVRPAVDGDAPSRDLQEWALTVYAYAE